MAKIFHALMALIASGTDRELAKYVEFLKEENKILRARIPGQVHTKPDERRRLVQLGKALGRAFDELLTIVSISTFYRWCRDETAGKKKANPNGGQRKPREIRELLILLARTTGFGLTLGGHGASCVRTNFNTISPNTLTIVTYRKSIRLSPATIQCAEDFSFGTVI